LTEGTTHDRTTTHYRSPTTTGRRAHHPRDNGGYGCHEVAIVGGCGEFTGHVWSNIHRDGDGTRCEFDATIDGLADASGSGLGSDPQRLRRLQGGLRGSSPLLRR